MLIAFVCVVCVLLGAPVLQGPALNSRVTIASDGWALVGNLEWPAGEERVPAVLMLNGAAHDRRAYIQLAAELASRGIASLRLDLRGEGESTNRGRFEPGQQNPDLAGEDRDVAAAISWLRRQSRVDAARLGVLGASYSGESMAAARRAGAEAAAYVALSPGSFSDESARAIDPSGVPWWFIASRQERFARSVVDRIPTMSLTARVTIVEGTSHASDILSPHGNLNPEIADWFASKLTGIGTSTLWGGLPSGAHAVGFRREVAGAGAQAVAIDVWYPAVRTTALPMQFADYVRLSDDLRGATPGFPSATASIAPTIATAISGEAGGVSADVVSRLLTSKMAARREAAAAGGRFPLVLWTPRYATTVAQSIVSEFLASHGFIVAFARPSTGTSRMPFELKTQADRTTELESRVADMRAALSHLEREESVSAQALAVIAWSYSGEMALAFQRGEPRVRLVAGLSTPLVSDWVFSTAESLASLDLSSNSAAYAILTERPTSPATATLLQRNRGAAYLIELPGLAHGNFNALEGYIPSVLGVPKVQPWSRSSPEGVRGYEAVGMMLLRLVRHHVAGKAGPPLSALMLTSGIPDGTVIVRMPTR